MGVLPGLMQTHVSGRSHIKPGGHVLLTNHLELASTTIAAVYKDRWQVELFFKALKQNLKVKTFVGTTENALRIQIWTALIALLLLRWLHHRSQAGWSLSNLACLLRTKVAQSK